MLSVVLVSIINPDSTQYIIYIRIRKAKTNKQKSFRYQISTQRSDKLGMISIIFLIIIFYQDCFIWITPRDDIIDALGEDASYYKGETSDSPDLTDTTTDNIKKNLRDMR